MTETKKKGALEALPTMRIGFINPFTVNEDKFPDKKFHWANVVEPGWGVAQTQGWMPCKEKEAGQLLAEYVVPAFDGKERNPEEALIRRGMVLCWMKRDRWDAIVAQERKYVEGTEKALKRFHSEGRKKGYRDEKVSEDAFT